MPSRQFNDFSQNGNRKKIELVARPEHCQTWSEEVAAAFPTRVFNPLVADVSGKSVLATRFLRPLRPPPELVGGEEPLAGTHLTRSSLVSNTLPLFHPVQKYNCSFDHIWPFLQLPRKCLGSFPSSPTFPPTPCSRVCKTSGPPAISSSK